MQRGLLFSWQMQKGNDLLLIYLFTLQLSASPTPLISITVQKGGFLISCMKTMPLLFWLHLPNETRLLTATDGLPSSLNIWLILGEQSASVCACYLDVCVCHAENASHIRHACNVRRSQVNPSVALGRPWRLPARWPWGSVDEWLSLHIPTLPPHTQV